MARLVFRMVSLGAHMALPSVSVAIDSWRLEQEKVLWFMRELNSTDEESAPIP